MLKYYVILTTHSSHHYSMWDFTHTCNPIIFLLCVSFCLFVGFKTSSWVMNKSYLLPPRLMSSFFFFLHHLWVFTCQPCTSFILHGNLTPYHCLAPLAIILLCWAFSKIICVGFMGLLVAIYSHCSNYKRDLPCSICKRASSTHTPFSFQL